VGDNRDGQCNLYDWNLSNAIPMDCFNVNFMKVIDTRPNKRDRISISGSLKLHEEDWLFDPDMDDVHVTVNDQVITVPAGSFEGKKRQFFLYYRFKGEIPDVGRVFMFLNFDRYSWWIYISGKDVGDFVKGNGAAVKLDIGMNTGGDRFVAVDDDSKFSHIDYKVIFWHN